MITEYKIRKLAYLNTMQVESALRKNYPKDTVKESKFLGITNGKQFCYEILYFDTDLGENAFTKVFVDLNASEEPIAEY